MCHQSLNKSERKKGRETIILYYTVEMTDKTRIKQPGPTTRIKQTGPTTRIKQTVPTPRINQTGLHESNQMLLVTCRCYYECSEMLVLLVPTVQQYLTCNLTITQLLNTHTSK